MLLKKIGRRVAIWILSCLLVLTSISCVGVVVAGLYAASLDTSLDAGLLSAGGDRTTRLYYEKENGEAVELSDDRISGYENALWCPLEEVSSHLIHAFVAIEDKRFFEHGGIDWSRTMHAALVYLQDGNADFGGSTITQQLVKNLTGDSERSVRRKLSEILRAIRLERMLSKQEILERYLNVVNLAENCYGVRTAANAYFSKEPSELSLAQAASIAAITNNPSKYNPVRHPQANRARRDLILREMYTQGLIDEAAYLAAVSEEVELELNEKALSVRVNSWYADMVIEDVIEALVRERGYSKESAGRLVYCGGLKIYTPMDPDLQRVVTDFYENTENFPTHSGGKKAQSALMLVDPKSGAILAVAGAVGEKTANRTQSFATDTKRPSGSVIKPLSVYAPALLENKITWASVFDDIPLDFKEDGAPWPRNSPNLYRGLTTVNTAICQSVNTVAVSVLNRVGVRSSYRFLRERLGFTSIGEADLGAAALALGQQHTGVTLREVVAGYTALAAEGVYHETVSFYRVLDSEGRVLLEHTGRQVQAMSREDAALLTMMLRGAVQDGTGSALSLKKTVDVAGKTGTTGKNCDKWFVGYTPELLCGVWYGYEYPAPLNDVKGNPALSIFDAVMHQALAVRPVRQRQFETPQGIVAVRYCKDSGLLPAQACGYDPRGDRTEYGYFKRGTEPTSYCNCHVCISYCTSGGGVATPHCPEEGCRKTALLRVHREFPRQIAVQDAPYTYGGLPFENKLDLSANEPYYAVNYDSKRNFGIPMGVIPYNRACPLHTQADFWRRRANVS